MGKKILVFIGASYVSGLEVVTLHLIRRLKEEGHEVKCVINGWNDGAFGNSLKEAGISFEEVKLGWVYLKKPLWTLDTLIHWPRAILQCRKIIQEFNPDVCHFCSYSTVLVLFACLKDRFCVYNLQESHLPTKKHLIIYRLLNKRIAIFTAVSDHIVRILSNLGIPGNKIRLIYNGVPPLPDSRANGKSGPPLIFGVIGQVVPWKGHHILIDAVEILAGRPHAPFQVHVYGNDGTAYAEEQKRRIREKNLEKYFSWKGFVRNQDAIYEQVDAVIVPSLSGEPCSLSILESMMRKKALIVSDRGGNPELVSHKETGLIFGAEEPAELAECIGLLLENPALTGSLGKKAGQKALEAYTVGRMTAEYVKAYSENPVAG
ncbi:MAG: glycosyltransferase family 4 protein [Puia sp.]|nr:glycosyltransferase family 4 protein [Puia sp.]